MSIRSRVGSGMKLLGDSLSNLPIVPRVGRLVRRVRVPLVLLVRVRRVRPERVQDGRGRTTAARAREPRASPPRNRCIHGVRSRPPRSIHGFIDASVGGIPRHQRVGVPRPALARQVNLPKPARYALLLLILHLDRASPRGSRGGVRRAARTRPPRWGESCGAAHATVARPSARRRGREPRGRPRPRRRRVVMGGHRCAHMAARSLLLDRPREHRGVSLHGVVLPAARLSLPPHHANRAGSGREGDLPMP